jgi:GNAT superfamily N-acetyltransferase
MADQSRERPKSFGLNIRGADRSDLPRLIELLAQLSAQPQAEDLGSPRPDEYDRALDAILDDPRQTLLVAEAGGTVIGMTCFVLVPNLSHIGRPYAFVEHVVVDENVRGKGYGRALMEHALWLARQYGCYKLTLVSANSRTDSHHFYDRLGFKATHIGYRMDL